MAQAVPTYIVVGNCFGRLPMGFCDFNCKGLKQQNSLIASRGLATDLAVNLALPLAAKEYTAENELLSRLYFSGETHPHEVEPA